MPRPRPPWWLLAVGICILGFLTLNLYTDAFGPGAVGTALRFADGRVEVLAVEPGSPAARVGIEPGDRVVAVSGQPVRTLFDWRAVLANAEVGRPLGLELERDGRPGAVELDFEPYWRRWTGGTWLIFAAKASAQLIVLTLAALLAFSRPHDRVALLGAWFLAAVSVTNMLPVAPFDPHVPTFPYGTAAVWRSLPWPVGIPLWVGHICFLVGPMLLVVFFALFPRPVFRSWGAWLALASPWAAILVATEPYLLVWSYRQLYEPGSAVGIGPPWFDGLVGAVVIAGLATGLALLVVNYRRLENLNERRRLRVLVWGAVIGISAAGTVAMAGFFDAPRWVRAGLGSPATRAVATGLYLLFPLSFAYAIARHRLFDIRLMIRQGLQYALVRGVVVSLVPVCAVALALDLLAHGDQPFRTIVLARGWIYAGVAGLALVAHLQRRQWLEAIDRRFFRDRYDAHHLLRDVINDIRDDASIERVAPRVLAQVEAALHPEFAALLRHDAGESVYRAIASVPFDLPFSALPAANKLVALVHLLGKPLEVSAGESGWLREQLPHGVTEFVRQARLGLLVPVASRAGGADALLALGIKRSEEPYSAEDQELMSAVASSLGLLLGRPLPPDTRDRFGECPLCGVCYDTGSAPCAHDGTALSTVRLPRVLAQRYRLERRLGRGGMGAVYEATDIALERRVAVKVIREELVDNLDAAERFRREARASASFSHPNVVTVHDFGIEAETRAFLVMELLQGSTLREVLQAKGRLSADRALSIVRDIGSAVEAAHRRPLVHRDLKPENVFLVRDAAGERAKVLDFGIAKILLSDGQTTMGASSGGLVGTVHYMGPEQLRGGPTGESWDLWALGVVTYEMLTGVLPFAASTLVDYQGAVLSGHFTPVGTYVPDHGGHLQAFFERALATDPTRRPSSPLVLLEELDRALRLNAETLAP